jgi:hypothetical protein
MEGVPISPQELRRVPKQLHGATTVAARKLCTFGSLLVEEPVARRSGCIQHIVWLALNIADWSISIKRPSAYGRNSERR